MNIINKLRSMGIEDVTEFNCVEFLNPKIEVDGTLYLGTIRGKQRLLMVKERNLNNSDGSEWIYPFQKKTCLYYLEQNEDLGVQDDDEENISESEACSFEWYWEQDIEM